MLRFTGRCFKNCKSTEISVALPPYLFFYRYLICSKISIRLHHCKIKNTSSVLNTILVESCLEYPVVTNISVQCPKTADLQECKLLIFKNKCCGEKNLV